MNWKRIVRTMIVLVRELREDNQFLNGLAQGCLAHKEQDRVNMIAWRSKYGQEYARAEHYADMIRERVAEVTRLQCILADRGICLCGLDCVDHEEACEFCDPGNCLCLHDQQAKENHVTQS